VSYVSNPLAGSDETEYMVPVRGRPPTCVRLLPARRLCNNELNIMAATHTRLYDLALRAPTILYYVFTLCFLSCDLRVLFFHQSKCNCL
jgi:hypothetical protein